MYMHITLYDVDGSYNGHTNRYIAVFICKVLSCLSILNGLHCLEQETLPSLLSTGWFEE